MSLSGVSKTAILTLRARAEEHVRPDRVFHDPLAAEWFSRVTWPPELDLWYSEKAQYALAFRADDIDHLTARYIQSHPSCAVTELGCGLSTRSDRLADLSIARWADVDFPQVAALRKSWGARGEQIGASVLDRSWMDRVATDDPAGHLFIAEGLFYYLPRAEVNALFLDLRRRFPGSAIILDVVGENDYRLLLQNTTAVGTPISWKLECDYSNVLQDFGLGAVEGFDPDQIMDESLMRYWDRFDPKLQGTLYWVMSSEALRRGRSGTFLGSLDRVTD